MSFGKQALIEDSKRDSTIKCLTNLYCAVLERKEFVKIVKKAQTREENKKIEFLCQLPFFKHQRPNQMRGFTKYFIECFYGMNQNILSQNEESKYVYIIKQGDFDVFCKIKQTKQKSDDPLDNRVKKERIFYKEMKVGTVSKGHLIGFNDVMLNRPYSVSVKCIVNSAIAYKIQADEFTNRMQKDQQSWSVLCKMCKDKDQITKDHIKQSNFNIKRFSKKIDLLDIDFMKKSPRA